MVPPRGGAPVGLALGVKDSTRSAACQVSSHPTCTGRLARYPPFRSKCPALPRWVPPLTGGSACTFRGRTGWGRRQVATARAHRATNRWPSAPHEAPRLDTRRAQPRSPGRGPGERAPLALAGGTPRLGGRAAAGGGVLGAVAGLRRPGAPGERGLHGPRQLGNGSRRRGAVPVRAPVGRRARQRDGDLHAGHRGPARCRHRQGPGPVLAATGTPRWTRWPNWLLCEVAIGACDLAEVLGSAVALNLLFHIPLLWAVIITAATCSSCSRCSGWGCGPSRPSCCCWWAPSPSATSSRSSSCPRPPRPSARWRARSSRPGSAIRGHGLPGHRHRGRDRHAPQPLPALGPGAEPPLPARRRLHPHRHPAQHHRLHAWRSPSPSS